MAQYGNCAGCRAQFSFVGLTTIKTVVQQKILALSRAAVGRNCTVGSEEKAKFTWPPASIPPVAEDYEFGKKWGDVASKLLLDGKIKARKLNVGEEGLNGVFEGHSTLERKQVNGEKLVYRVGETP
ncbi:hypothetical protein V1523DRAFT_398524 [Lipomyces doorenjongii]